jgi:phage recombination protein Bet
MSDAVIAQMPAIRELAGVFKLDALAFIITFRKVAMPKDHTDEEFVSCCLVAREHGLNPLTKEIYFMRDKHGKIQAIVGVDGWIKKCNEHPQFDGVEFKDTLDAGKMQSITARIFRKDRSRPVEVTEYMSECVQKRDKAGPWDTHPNRMLRHRAMIQGARIAFGFAGIMDRDEFDQWHTMKDVTPPPTTAALDLPDIPDEAPADDQSAVLREIEKALDTKPASEVENEFKSAIMAMDEDGRTAAIEMLQAAKEPVAAE